jgi:hypothetical protein
MATMPFAIPAPIRRETVRGWASMADERTCRVTEPCQRHICNVYCRNGAHADLAYYHGHGRITAADMARVAARFRPGYRILDVRPAAEAPVPDGYESAWLVTYERPAA